MISRNEIGVSASGLGRQTLTLVFNRRFESYHPSQRKYMSIPNPKFNIHDLVCISWANVSGKIIGRGYSKTLQSWCYVLNTYYNTRVFDWLNGESMDQNTVEYLPTITEFNQKFWNATEAALTLVSEEITKDETKDCNDDNGGLDLL